MFNSILKIIKLMKLFHFNLFFLFRNDFLNNYILIKIYLIINYLILY